MKVGWYNEYNFMIVMMMLEAIVVVKMMMLVETVMGADEDNDYVDYNDYDLDIIDDDAQYSVQLSHLSWHILVF